MAEPTPDGIQELVEFASTLVPKAHVYYASGGGAKININKHPTNIWDLLCSLCTLAGIGALAYVILVLIQKT